MFYRKAGQLTTSYAQDLRVFPLREDRYFVGLVLLAAILVVPFIASPYVFSALLLPFLILSLAAIGLNLVTGYAGLFSLGSAAFMAIGAVASYNLMLRVPGTPSLLAFGFGGLMAAGFGLVIGLPSLRIRGFYLAVATLAAQFFVLWAMNKIGWLTNYSATRTITAQAVSVVGIRIDTPASKYLLTLSIVVVLALLARNLLRCNLGRTWIAIRDMDLAAEVIGVKVMRTKLLAFAISSFYCGVAGALYLYMYLGTLEADAFGLDLSLKILFMIIIGGMGALLGAFLGAAFIVLLPIGLNFAAHALSLPSSVASHLEMMLFGALIVTFLLFESHGLARIWRTAKHKLLIWPFPR